MNIFKTVIITLLILNNIMAQDITSVKINELATSAINSSDYFVKADTNGIAYKNTVSALANFIGSVGVLGYQGTLAVADTPTEDGFYFASESGTYTNAGGLVVDLAAGINIISVTDGQTVFDLVVIPIDLSSQLAQTVTEGDTTHAPSADAVFDYVGDAIYREKYPFTDGSKSVTPGGRIIPESFLFAEIRYANGVTKFMNNGKPKVNFLKAIGNFENKYQIVVSRQLNNGSYADTVMSMLVSEISDVTNVRLYADLGSTILDFVVDFTGWSGSYATGLTVDDTAFSILTIKSDGELEDRQQTSVLNFSKRLSEYYNDKLRNELDSTDDLYDGSYSWWCRPHSLQDEETGITWMTYVTRKGDQVICKLSGEKDFLVVNTEKLYPTDEHNSPAIHKVSTDNWVIGYTGHDDGNILRLRKAKNPLEDISEEKYIKTVGNITYCQFASFGSTVLCVFRIGGGKWQFVISSDSGESWSLPKDFLVQGSTSYGQIYLIIQQTNTKWVKVFHYFGLDDAGDDNRIMYSAVDLENLTAHVVENGAQIADLNTQGMISDDCRVMYNTTTGYNLRLLDASGNNDTKALFTFSEHLIGDSSVGSYFYANHNIGANSTEVTEIVPHGGNFTHTYPGGAYFVQDRFGDVGVTPNIFTSRNDGGLWKIERQVKDGSVFIPELKVSDSIRVVRPVPPLGSLIGSGIEFHYIKGTYIGFEDWNTVIKKENY